MKLLYEEMNGTIKILRCCGAENGYGERGTIVLPESICGQPVTELGDYLFSADMREQPRGFWWDETDEIGAAGPESAELDSGGEESEESGSAESGSAESESEPADVAGHGRLAEAASRSAGSERSGPDPGTEILCGSRVRTVHLPASLRRIGRYAFYNCDNLRELHFTASISDIGAGAFNGCRKITDLYVDVITGEKSCLKEILADLNETLTVHYRELSGAEPGTVEGEARLLFPLFYEEAVENTPARILETHVHGCGHRYRYCFQGTEFRFREYDSLFIHARTQEEPEHVAALAMGRLQYPYQLTAEAEREYGEYLMEHLEDAAAGLLRAGSMEDLRWFVGYFAPGPLAPGSSTPGDFAPGNAAPEPPAPGLPAPEHGDEKAAGHSREGGLPPVTKNEHAAAGCLGNEGLAVRAREEYYDIRKPILGEIGFDKLVELANRAGRTEATVFLMDARYRSYPPKRKRFIL